MTYPQGSPSIPLVIREQDIEVAFIEKLRGLKYSYRPDIRDRAALEHNFRQKFEALNRVRLTDGEQLTELLEPLGLAWKDRRVAELALMADLVPLLKKRAAGRDISGLSAYE